MMRSKKTIATPPGATIKEQLVDRGMSQKEFASRMEMSEKHISKLVNGAVQLTPDVAMRLEMVLGIPAHFWNNLESIYREKLARVKAENDMEEDLEIVRKLPYNEMAKNNWVPETSKPEERVMNSRKFFEVVRLGMINGPLIPNIAYRRVGNGAKSDYALICWAQKAKLEARDNSTSPINVEKLNALIPVIRSMTSDNPEVFCPVLCEKLSECGIALVFLPHIGGSFLHGATFYDGSKIVIGVTIRGKDADRFWFSLFHEFGHIVLGHIDQPDGTTDEDETMADNFSRNALIPDDMFSQFVNAARFDKDSIEAFARQVGIDSGIVVGRLQKEQYIPFSWYGELKTKYVLTA